MSEKLNRFVDLMKSIFELDKSDLDFGIYRIMNIRKDEIEKFLAEGLPKKVQDTLAPFASNTEIIEKRITEIEKQCADLGIEITASPKLAEEYSHLKSQLTAGVDISALETDVYSALYNFFNRYYDEGDFISKRRYKEGVYAIPYEGEEVKLYWANQDQYYIKTAENFKDYTFIDDGRKVHFRLVEATTEQNNNKESDDKKRTFMLYDETDEKPELKTMEVIDGELYIRFVFDVPTDKKIKYAEENYKKICAAISSQYKDWFSLLRPAVTKDPKKIKSVLEKHLEGYVAKNTFDYFIHKDLRGFLSRELDFYIKSEVIHLDDIDTTDEKRADAYIAKVRAIKRVGKIIMDFLAQIEDFQKKLWLKKKFIVSTDWCITLDNIDEAFYEEIIKNKAQVLEWVEMYAINEIEANLTTLAYSDPVTMDFLRQNKNLVVDTKHFTTDFKDRLIASIDDLDARTGGLLLHSENFQALSVLSNKYKRTVKCVYIDPPYNAKTSEILYKNTFKHSSWLSLMENRMSASEAFMIEDGVMVIAIDEIEQTRLGELLRGIYSNKEITAVTIVHNPSGQQGDNFSYTNEFAYFVYPDFKNIIGKEQRSEEDADTRTFRDNSGNSNLRTDAANCFYPIFVRDDKIIGFGEVSPDEFHPASRNINMDDGVVAVYPIDNNGIEKKWVFERGTVEGIIDELWVKEKDGNSEIDIMRTKNIFRYKTTWTEKKYSANSYGSTLLTAMNIPFGYPKSIYNVQDCVNAGLSDKKEGVVLDYFAGSGTTGHAVILQNHEDDGKRKYILVEMGEYFYNATLPRIKKAVYAPGVKDWKKGIPLKRNAGVSHIIKYFKLESYEDALSNISLSEEKHKMSALFGEDYLINYMFDAEAQGSMLKLDSFKMPFSYKMKINENNETKEKIVDLCETFNYLVGLSVVRQSVVSYFKAESDKAGEYEGAVRLVKDMDGKFAFKQIEGTLPDGRRTLIIWRTIIDNLIESNAALDAYFNKHRINPLDREFDVIYVNGDNNLENLKADDEHWKVNMIEPKFKQRMFEEV